MSPRTDRLRVGTRGSALALTQTDRALRSLTTAARHAGVHAEFEVVRISTVGDRHRDRPFEAIGPKGIFAKDLQRALEDGTIDAAVHSLKDLPATEPDGLVVAAVPEREDARDVLVSREGTTLADLPPGAVVGTSAARRRLQVLAVRPDLEVAPLRGNVDTRLAKVASGEVDAAVLAGAGIERLGRGDVVTEWLDPLRFVPSPGQGALAIEVRAARASADLAWVCAADDPAVREAITAELEFTRLMEGACDVPLGAWARRDGGKLALTGFFSDLDGRRRFTGTEHGGEPEALARTLAERLLDEGARGVLDRLRS